MEFYGYHLDLFVLKILRQHFWDLQIFLLNFEKKIFNFISEKENIEISYSAEPKIDGISASLTYRNGNFIKGLSRGDGKEGEDITQNLQTINDIPKSISAKDFPTEIDIRGEVFIQNKKGIKLKAWLHEKDLI